MAARLRKGRWLNISVTKLISIGFGALVAVAVSLVLFMSVLANFKNTFSLLNDKAILITQSMERQVRAHLDTLETSAVGLKGMFDEGRLSLERTDEMIRELSSAAAANARITAIIVTDTLLEEYGVYKAENGKLWPFKRAIPAGYDQNYDIPDISKESGPTWGELVDTEYGLFANVTVPLVLEDKLIGLLTIASTMDKLADDIKQLDDGPDSTTFIIANGNQVVVHSDMEGFQTGVRPIGSLPIRLKDLGDEVLFGMEEQTLLPEFGKAAQQGIQVLNVETQLDEFILMRVPLEGYSARPWIIGQYFRAASISQEVRRIIGSAAVGFAALVLAVLIAVWMGRRVASPLKMVARQSERVGKLALEDVEPLPRSRVREIDQVALAFNAMVIGLKAMNTYVPRSLFSKLMRLGVNDAAKAREAELTIVFTDIVGFTALSENLSASDTAGILNKHFAILVEAVEEEGGTVDKFIGDGMLAFWGAPDARADHAEAAVRTAQKISRSLTVANEKAKAEGLPEIRMRIGIHTGQVLVGNVGALDRWNYTIVGDAVNVSERLQHLGRDVETAGECVILASAETVAQLPGRDGLEKVGTFQLRGRSSDIEVWMIDPEAQLRGAVPIGIADFPPTAAE